MTLAALMDMLDITIVNVALPTLQRRLQATATELEWLIAAYLLAFGATLIVWGRLGDRYGRRRVFLVAVAVFGVASLGAGLSAGVGTLISFRVLQGAAAGALVPQVLATFRAALDSAARIAAFGVYGAIAGLAAAVGVVLGGVLTQYSLFGLGWRAIFLINVPVSALVLIVGFVVVPETRPQAVKRLDRVGALILPVSLAAAVYALLEGRSHHWAVWIFVLMAAGLGGVALVVTVERRAGQSTRWQPLLDVAQFRIPAFSVGLAVQALFSAALQGFSVTFVLWVQVGHSYTPIHTGLLLLAFSVGAILTAPQAGKLAEARGKRILILGAGCLSLGVLIIAVPAWRPATDLDPWTSLIGFVIAGAGLGLLIVPLVNVVLAAVPADTAGGASGLFTTAQQVGGAVGVATIGTIFFSHTTTSHLNDAFGTSAAVVAALYAAAGLLCVCLPSRALSESEVVTIL